MCIRDRNNVERPEMPEAPKKKMKEEVVATKPDATVIVKTPKQDTKEVSFSMSVSYTHLDVYKRQAQYRELEAFTKFSGDMDPVTAHIIDKGQKNTRLLVQPQYSPMPVEKQIAILYCGVLVSYTHLDVYKRQTYFSLVP